MGGRASLCRRFFKTITRKKLEDVTLGRLEAVRGDVIIELGGSYHPRLEMTNGRLKANLDIDFLAKPTVVADAHELPIRGESVDVVIAIEILEHCHDPWKVVDEIWRVLRKEGLCIASTRFIFPIHRVPEDYFRFTDAGLRHLFRHFRSKTIMTQGSFLSSVFDLAATRLPYLMVLTPLLGRLPDVNKTNYPLGYFVEARK